MPLTDTERAAILADLAAIKSREEAATPLTERGLPWRDCYFDEFATDADYAFIAASRSDVPRLIGYVERLLGEGNEEDRD